MSKLPFTHHSQSEYALGKDLNLLPFELFNHVKTGRLHPLDKDTGQAIPRPDVLRIKQRLEKNTDETKLLPLRYGKIKTGHVVMTGKYNHFDKERERQELDKRARELPEERAEIEKELQSITNIYDWTTYNTPNDPRPAFAILQNSLFKKSEVEQLNITDGGKSPAMSKPNISRSDFILLCRVDNPRDWFPGMEVRLDGVWVVPPDDNLGLVGHRELAVLNEHPKDDLTIPALSFPCSFTEFENFLIRLGGGVEAYVRADDLEAFLKEKTKAPETAVSKENSLDINAKEPLTKEQAEEIIKAMTVIRVSDDEIIIKHGDKQINATCKDIGFKSYSKPWQMFMDVLQDRSNQYFIGSYDKKNPINKKDYSSKSKLFSNFSKKFIEFINSKFSLSLPGGFNVFQNMKHRERAGIYQAKFRVDENQKPKQQADIKNLAKDETLAKLEDLFAQHKCEKDESAKGHLFNEISKLAAHAKQNGWAMPKAAAEAFLDTATDLEAKSDALEIADYIDEVTGKDKYRL
jgi:hypothetical protein